jgi:gliding-associated putative ABC transporter substrate-binding component GldG
VKTAKVIDKTVLVLGVIGTLVAINILGVGLFGRLDLTRDKEFTLSKATLKTLKDLHEPITVRAYFTKDLPPPYSTNSRYVKDLLDEYYNHSNGHFRYEFIDPAAQGSQADKDSKKNTKTDIFGRQVREMTPAEQALQELGIPPVQVRVNEADRLEVKRAYMGLSIQFGDKKEAIPVVQKTDGLEYDLTTLIRKLTREKIPKLAIVTGHGAPDLQKDLGKAAGILGELYTITTTDLSNKIADDVDVLLVIGPKIKLSEAEQHIIDDFIVSGKSAAFLLDAVSADLQTLAANEADHGLTELLTAYGVKILPGLILDSDCATIAVSQQRGFMRIQQPVRYPFMPTPKNLDNQHPLTRGLSEITFAFMSPLETAAPTDVQADSIVNSSAKSWVQKPPYNLDPMQRWTSENAGEPGEKHMVITLAGSIKSFFNPDHKGPKTRILVAGGSTFVTDQFLSKPNEAFLLNLVDWLVLDEDMMLIRSRGLAAAPIKELSDAQRASVKYWNVVGLPLLLIGFGLLRWRLRETQRAKMGV